jgi:hypothetical protein
MCCCLSFCKHSFCTFPQNSNLFDKYSQTCNPGSSMDGQHYRYVVPSWWTDGIRSAEYKGTMGFYSIILPLPNGNRTLGPMSVGDARCLKVGTINHSDQLCSLPQPSSAVPLSISSGAQCVTLQDYFSHPSSGHCHLMHENPIGGRRQQPHHNLFFSVITGC